MRKVFSDHARQNLILPQYVGFSLLESDYMNARHHTLCMNLNREVTHSLRNNHGQM